MNVTFLIPPQFDGQQPAERSAGCTRVVYQAPNIYELTVVAIVREIPGVQVAYKDFIHKKHSKKDFAEFIHTDNSDVYCFWVVNLSINNDLEAIEVIRSLHPQAKIVLMGPGPTYFTKKCLPDKYVTIVRGEPDDTLAELITCWNNGEESIDQINGISYLKDGNVITTAPRPLIKDLDRLPFPARDLVKDIAFHNPKLKTGPYTTMVTSRNCPFHCIYCVPSSLTFAREIENRRLTGHKPPISFRSVESIEKEISQLEEDGYRAIGFMDDNFIWNEQRTVAICQIMKRHNMVWGCEARVDAITEPIAKALSEGNCRYVDLGIESFNDEILAYIKKGIKVADIYRAIKLLKQYKVPVKLNVLIGSSPLETRETVIHTLREAKKLNVDQVMFNIVSPFPGTEFYKIVKENGWLKTEDYVPTDVQRESILSLPNLSAKEMEKLLFHNNVSFFLSPKFIIKQMRRFYSWTEFCYALKALKRKLFG